MLWAFAACFFICLCCEHLHHLLSKWWKCFLDLLPLFLFACVFWSCSALSSLSHRRSDRRVLLSLETHAQYIFNLWYQNYATLYWPLCHIHFTVYTICVTWSLYEKICFHYMKMFWHLVRLLGPNTSSIPTLPQSLQVSSHIVNHFILSTWGK